MVSNRQFVIVDHSLKGYEGHYFEYTLASAKALAQEGVSVQVSCHKNFATKTIEGLIFNADFSVTWTDSTRFEKIRLWLQLFLRTIFGLSVPSFYGRFGSELKKALSALPGEVFIHTLSFTQLFEVCEIIPGLATAPRFHIVLRYDPGAAGLFGIKSLILKLLFRWIAKTKQPIRFYSDTPELCQALQSRFKIPVALLPILFERIELQPHPTDRVTLSYLGDARLEKGFQHLPKILRAVLAETQNTKFLLQLNVNKFNQSVVEITEAADELRRLSAQYSNRIELIEGPLSPEAYKNLILTSDIVLLPYDARAYRLRSSGILVQCAAAGKIVLVPSDTSMDTMVAKNPAVTFQSPEEIPQKLITICQNWPKFQKQAQDEAPTWSQIHSPQNFAKQLLKP